jgi:hypothetical protein
MARGNNHFLNNTKSHFEIAQEVGLQIKKLKLTRNIGYPYTVAQGNQQIDINLLDHSKLPYNSVVQVYYDPFPRKFYVVLNNFCEETSMFVRISERQIYARKTGCTCHFEQGYRLFEILHLKEPPPLNKCPDKVDSTNYFYGNWKK